MAGLRNVARCVLALAAAAAWGACAQPEPTKWTLWYTPGETKAGSAASRSCRTYVFATPDQADYAVAVMKGWNGPNPPTGPGAAMYTGEDVIGTLDLGSQSVHDASNGHDLNVNVIYRVRAYVPAKLRADSVCNLAERSGAARGS